MYGEVGQKSEALFTRVFEVADSKLKLFLQKNKTEEPLGWVDFFKFHMIFQKMIS